jgi:hypothetical protein
METPVKSKIKPETYIIRAGTILYRGDTPFYIANKDVQSRSLEQKPTFFGLEPHDVKQYGIIHSWTVPHNIELLHLDNPDVMKRIYDGAPEDVQDVLKNNYGYNPESNIIGNSKSIFERDKIFYEYLCTTGSPGYASTRDEGAEISSYEVMICDPANFVFSDIVFLRGVRDNMTYIDSEIKKYNERINPKENLGKKKRSSESVVETPPSKLSDFASSSVESSPVVYSPVKYSQVEYSQVEYSQVEYSQVEYSPEGQVMYSPLKIRRGTPSPIKMTSGTSFVDSPEKMALFSSPEKELPLTVFGALFPSPKKGGSRKRKVMKTRKSKRGKLQLRKSRSK